MLPPGLGFTAMSQKAIAASKTNRMPRSYWDWGEMLTSNANGFFPYTPSTNLLYGLREAISMLLEEGLDRVFARHQRLASATRAAVQAWGLEILCQEPLEYSPVLTDSVDAARS
jgi:alanine-glyoxylate transaminase/serine-glyoxylate transaminase/serine-pyruvate transaminase